VSAVADAFLIPDNHLGRATVSSVAVAHEVEAMGGRSIACLNSRDRNLLGLRRDLLTAAAYGVDQFLFVYGDKPDSGGRTGELTVRAMIEEARTWPREAAFAGARPFPVRWREANPVDVPVFAGVMVLASAAHARRLAAAIPDIDIPAGLVERIAADRLAGVEATCEYVRQIRDSGAFDGVHLIPVARYREVAARLEQVLR
jgi:5,10-methylenetetrahydrofolate reductase